MDSPLPASQTTDIFGHYGLRHLVANYVDCAAFGRTVEDCDCGFEPKVRHDCLCRFFLFVLSY